MKKNVKILCITTGILIVVGDMIWGVSLIWSQIIEIWNAFPHGRNFINYISALLIGFGLIATPFDYKNK